MIITEELLKNIDSFLYNLLDEKVDIMPLRFVKLIAYYYTDARIRKKYLRRLGFIMGENTYSNLGLNFTPLENEKISVEIGDNVSIAPSVTFISESSANNGKDINDLPYLKKVTKSKKIIIENDVWIGANVTILPGIKVGKCSIIGAGSVVINDIEPYSIYAGVPAKKIRELK